MKTIATLYGGDAENLSELALGDVFTADMLWEGVQEVHDGKHQIQVYLPKQNMLTLSTENCMLLQPKMAMFTRDLKLFRLYGVEMAKIVVIADKPKKVPNQRRLKYVTTRIVCDNREFKIYTAVD